MHAAESCLCGVVQLANDGPLLSDPLKFPTRLLIASGSYVIGSILSGTPRQLDSWWWAENRGIQWSSTMAALHHGPVF